MCQEFNSAYTYIRACILVHVDLCRSLAIVALSSTHVSY